ncbi:MAG TPA: Fic family protein [Kofleriaceae bacterium]|jgi:fido (protein-threonine AMPylation protein)
MTHERTIRWQPITKLDPPTVHGNGRFAAVEALRGVWTKQLGSVSEAEATRRRQRTLRRLAIETGIIERLYEIDWGLTLTLVAEGFAREVIERANGTVDDWTLATLNAQREALEMVVDFVRRDRKLTPSFIKELHYAITRTQTHYEATDPFGNSVERHLPRGVWKQWPNHVVRQDESILEYCPPEHVDSEVDNLSNWYEQLELDANVHPLVKAAWLHHRFVQIHPFADGNGRVARSLTMLVLQRHRYAPIVVTRHHRTTYLQALDRANEGDLNPLVQLFVNLESSALVGELEQPGGVEANTSKEVAHTLAAQIAARRHNAQDERRNALMARITAINAMVDAWVKAKRGELKQQFSSQGLSDIDVHLMRARSDQLETNKNSDTPKHLYFRRQVIASAHEAGHYANLSGFVALFTLRITIEGVKLSYVVSIHGAGEESGVQAITNFAVIREGDPEIESEDVYDVATASDAFYFSYSEPMQTLNERKVELEELLDGGLVVALAALAKRL